MEERLIEMGLYGYPKYHSIYFLGGFNTWHGDDRVSVTMSDKHGPLLQRLWEDSSLCRQVADLLMESADVNQYYLGYRLLKISERGLLRNGRDIDETNQTKENDGNKEES
jgi:hypothetical protein